MAPQRRNAIRRDEPVSLRRGNPSNGFEGEQLILLCIFAGAVIQSGKAIYLRLNAEGDSCRMKIYGDDEVYQDSVSNRDDLRYIFHDYASQLKALPFYQELMATLHAATAQEAPTAPEAAPPTPKSGK